MNARAPQDHTLLIAALAVLLFHSPLSDWWTGLALPWYALFAPWLLVIVLVWANRRDSGG